MASYTQVQRYLESFINYEKSPFFPYKSFKLQRMHTLAESLDISLNNSKVIHVAGTKGKGSTAHFCAYLLASCGYRTGLYTSPHFFDFRERIKIIGNGFKKSGSLKESKISREDVTRITENLQRVLKKRKTEPLLERVSFFEVYTAIALKYFIYKETDFIVMETGLGGRLDATNIVKPSVSVITPVGYDHMDKLGRTLEQIAYEKAGIIKYGAPVVCSAQRPQVLQVIKRQCRAAGTNLYIEGKDFYPSSADFSRPVTNFDFNFADLKLTDMKIRLKGKNQVQNAACALAVIRVLQKMYFPEKDIPYRQGLLACNLPGRFEILKENPLIIMDVAHNESSFKSLGENLEIYFPDKEIILIFACSKDKLPGRMLKNIKYSKVIFTSFSNPRSCDPDLLAKNYPDRLSSIAPSAEEALSRGLRLYTKESAIVISGSFFLVSEAREIIDSHFNDCLTGSGRRVKT